MSKNVTQLYSQNHPQVRRFWKKVDKCGATQCWLWLAARSKKGGYGVFAFNGNSAGCAHRFSYLLHRGEIPPGKIVMHTCDFPPCVNPAHLKLGTQLDNVRDSIAKGRWFTDKRIVGYRSEAKLMCSAERKPKPSSPLPIGKKYGEIGIPEPGDGYDMGIFVILGSVLDAKEKS